jgi:hypothetical protein
MTNGAQTGAYRNVLRTGHDYRDRILVAPGAQPETLSLRHVWYRAIASVRNIWQHLRPDPCPN